MVREISPPDVSSMDVTSLPCAVASDDDYLQVQNPLDVIDASLRIDEDDEHKDAVSNSVVSKLNATAEQLSKEALCLHDWVRENKKFFSDEAHRSFLAQSAAMLGKRRNRMCSLGNALAKLASMIFFRALI